MDINHSEYEHIYTTEKFAFNGLKKEQVAFYREKYGNNGLGDPKRKSTIAKILKALSEPMLLILLFACVITIGINIGNLLSGKEADFYECIGIVSAIALSAGLTVFMENKSEKAFEALKKMSGSILVSLIRDNEKLLVDYTELVVGDVVLCEAGDKITADGVLIECNDIETEESSLTGESKPVLKETYISGKIAEKNMLYSGSYLKSGNGKMIVLATGKNAQIGKIASNLNQESNVTAPLSQKLNALSKKISIFGASAAVFTFLLTLFKLYASNSFNFENIKEAFIEAVVLIVAAVPEGLPTTVAIALALSAVKLAKSNAVIKKLIAAETVGCVSVICSDKTGTLTVGKMEVQNYVINAKEVLPVNLKDEHIINNVVYNSTAFFVYDKGKVVSYGNTTEQALITSLFRSNYKKLNQLRSESEIAKRVPFSSKRKYMLTTIRKKAKTITYVKGAIEVIAELCNCHELEKARYLDISESYASKGERVIAFAHGDGEIFNFDGFCVISDVIRDDVYSAVNVCKSAGIGIKVLTGDNKATAIAIAKKLGLPCFEDNVLTGSEIEKLNFEQLKEILPKITIIARSTPETKLRVVKTLQVMGEIVAVTGDGVNDAPAIKSADIGIAMGDGSEITKEASDIILLDNSFAIIVKAVAFGRNIYRNFQRFLFFQLTVNFSAVGLIVAFLALGFKAPFSAVQLLWINIIMDGPLALSLGLEKREELYLDEKPVKRTDSIVTKKMFLRIFFHALIIDCVIVLQKLFNFLNSSVNCIDSTIFSLFVIFQLCNAINAREIGNKSILNSLGKNKLFSILLIVTLCVQYLITEFLYNVFYIAPIGFVLWGKILLVGISIILISELYKYFYRVLLKRKVVCKIIKRRTIA